MTNPPLASQVPLDIHKPCPKLWTELEGDEKKRFCSACSLHVHNAAQLTQLEARTMVTNATSRVCMRIEYDASGTPIFRDSPSAIVPFVRTRKPVAARLARWALSAAAGVLAACHGSISTPAVNDPAGPNVVQPPPKMGKVVSTKLGDVAVPLPEDRVKMGEMAVPTDPPIAPTPPDAPPDHNDE